MESTKQKATIRIIENFAKVVVSGILAVFFLSAFCLVYNHTGLRIKSESGATDYHWETDTIISNMKEGISWIKTDANGYNNASIPENVDILLMGSSHMEAVQVSQSENTAALLNTMLPGMKTYNTGISGHTIYRCVDNIGSAISSFCPSDYVIIETNRIRLDISEMSSVIAGNAAKESASSDGKLMMIIQKIPAFKPLYNQLMAWISQDAKQTSKDAYMIEELDDYCTVLNLFLNIVEQSAKEQGVQAIIFYDPPQEFLEDGSLDYFHTDEDIVLFSEACAANNIIFLDMTSDFKKMYEEERILAHGFSNTGVGIGHLNKYGHKVIAEKLVEVIGGEN